MRFKSAKVGVVVAAAAATMLPVFAQSASADYAPSFSDVVGVGSDTVQYAGDFVADGDFVGDTGYNALGNLNRVINFDATPDSNARLAYGSPGVGPGTCPAGLGGTVGTGNQTGSHPDQPCTLNPTVVLRAGLAPVQRVNGSGAAGKAGVADTRHYLDYLRASSAQGATLNAAGTTVQWDSITIGTDFLGMLTANTTNAVALSKAQLNAIYSCSSTARTWNQVGGTSTDAIIPILPQVGSGTRSSWLNLIGSPTLGSCVVTAEENDPFAIAAQGTGAVDAIEPMSQGRLNLFQGKNGSGAPNAGTTSIPYFQDPSCPVESTNTLCTGTAGQLVPAVKYAPSTGTASDGSPVLDSTTRNLYIYFRDTDINSTTKFQPGGTNNFVRTLFYNPGTTPGTFGPGGAPYYDTSAGQALVSAAGIAPAYTVSIPGA